MQTVSSGFTTLTSSAIRPLNQKVYISFLKNYDASIDFFTIGTSLIGGTDFLKGSGSVVQEWDKYDYTDYSSRVISISYNREADLPLSPVTMAQAEIVLDNSDDMFTSGNPYTPLNGYLLPKRPVKISIGFGSEAIQVFVGLTTGMPIINTDDKTATIRCMDILSMIIDRPLDSSVMYQDDRADVIIQDLLTTHGGLLSSQLSLALGSVIIPFAYFAKGSKLRDGLEAVIEADLGNLFVAESGVITYQSRGSWLSNSLVWNFNRDNVYEMSSPGDENIINVVEVYSNVRGVKSKQKIWEQEGTVEIPANSSVDIWASFTDDDGDLPVTSADDPVYIASATTSFYATNRNEDGSGATDSSSVSLTATSLFATSFKMTFANSSALPIFITQLEVWGTPAKVTKKIYVREQSDASVGTFDAYDENPLTINNDLIQDETVAASLALIVIGDRDEPSDTKNLMVKGVPQMQLGDVVNFRDQVINQNYYVTRINGIMDASSGFRQYIQLTKKTIEAYFRIGISTIGGTDKIAP
jgi:hypothetical protein